MLPYVSRLGGKCDGRLPQICYIILSAFSFLWADLDIVFVCCLMAFFLSGVNVPVSLIVVHCFMLSYTPFCIPLGIFSLGSFVWLWRSGFYGVSSVGSAMLQSAAVGFTMCWSISGFIVPAIDSYGLVIQALICCVFSLQYVAIAIATYVTRDVAWLRAQMIIFVCAMVFECLEAYMGVCWSATNILLSISYTPLAQWSRVLTPFGLTGVIYWLGIGSYVFFERLLEGRIQIVFPSSVIFVLLWIGGLLQSNTECAPLGLSVALVQPHVHHRLGPKWQPWELLDRLTIESVKNDGAVDLVVWPETSIPESWSPRQTESTFVNFGLNDMLDRARNRYRTNLIAGCVIGEKGLEKERDAHRYNCACLFSSDGELAIHKKLILVPLREQLPVLLRFEWVRGAIHQWFGMNGLLSAGTEFHHFEIESRKGNTIKILPVVCYESWHPWLPQFSNTNSPRVYLLYDGDFYSRPELVERQIQGISLRSIETKSWGLVCSTWAGTCIIDPNGKIVRKAPTCEFVLRTDTVVEVKK